MPERAALASVLLLDNESGVRTVLHRYLTRIGCEVRQAGSVAEAREILARNVVEIAFIEYSLPDGNGAEFARWALSQNRVKRAYCVTSSSSNKVAVEAMKAGCLDVLEKPLDLERVEALISETVEEEQGSRMDRWRKQYASNIIGEDDYLLDALDVVSCVADTDCTVLVMGESGTGKELIAQALHNASPRREGPFVALNCAAIPESLIESELFGHTRGAFTGAVAPREGKIAAADGGTLFLDEIGDMPLAAQAKLLRVLQENALTPVGTNRQVAVNIRIVAATNRDLESMVANGTFRGDLYYRLSVIRVELPPLRERACDILPLAYFYLKQANQKTGRAVTGFDRASEELLLQHTWPGNIREMANTILRAVLLRRENLITPRDLQITRRAPRVQQATAVASPLPAATVSASMPASVLPSSPVATAANGSEALNLKAALDDVERQLIQQALDRTNGNRTEAAALLGLNRTTLVEKLRKFTG